jgi:putative ABC transport system permease protein
MNNAFSLALASIKSRRLNTALCVAASAAGIALLCTVFLLSQAIDTGFSRNAEGIDIVVGAKGSPLQLVLSSVYHADVPNANIEAADADKISHNPQVKQVIPLAIGDSHKGWRIVGTTQDYLALYGATFNEGHTWQQPFEAVAGALTGLKTGEQFPAVHGLSVDSDDVHHFHLYKIVGTLKPTGTVLDRLILTSVSSVQELHKHPDLGDPDAAEEKKIGHQVTALLLKTKSPVAIMNLPRQIDSSSNLLAASPAYEMTRLASSLGIGRDVLTVLGIGFIALSALMLLSTLASSLTARRYDLGVLRVLGASPLMLAGTVMAEGLILSGLGAVAGIIAGHALAFAIAVNVDSLRGVVLPAMFLAPQAMDGLFLLIGLAAGLVAGLVPAVSAGRTDIAALLARGRA